MRKQRVEGLDTFRGWAILFMVAYHFTYDLNHFNLISVNMDYALSFLISRYTIMSMFLVSVGVSLALVHQHGIKWTNIKKRIIQLGMASTLVTIATYIEFPHSWVYFGILHCILVASLIGLLFLPYPKVTLVSAILILVTSATNTLSMEALFQFMQPILNLPTYTEDLVPFVPWFAMVLIGIVLVQFKLHQKLFNLSFFSNNSLLNRGLKFMGKHSLLIYLIHQPILFAGFMLFLK